MLVLARQLNERIVMPTVPATIEVVAIKSNCVRLGIDASAEVAIWREEVLRRGEVAPDNLLALSEADEKRDRDRSKELLCKRCQDVALGLDLIRQQIHETGKADLRALIEHMRTELSRIDREVRSLLSSAAEQPSFAEMTSSRRALSSRGVAELQRGMAT